ncbi:metallophosphoesterase family protein [Metabacillus arenae]|uniref:Phosphoesterase n=1 Tax=Metabacillus arenae TaxID=2771434 RepID=A0A926NIS2_9BACI|nr:metallophosphoesterase [Metabacillus arenae]MBD1381298.1 metallophosphoesterase [Metabacillus arenae]
MKIIVLADTHIPKKAKKLPEILIEHLKESDLIIHAGDWQTLEVYDELAKYGNVVGVAGNVDDEKIQQKFGLMQTLFVHGYRIGIVHGHGARGTTKKRVLEAFKEENMDCIIFGHSHIPVNEKIEGTFLFNPGSPTDKRRQPKFSFGVITVTEKDFQIDHVFFSKKD